MKYSLCSIGFRKSNLPFSEIASIVSELNYDGIEIWSHHLDDQDPSLLKVLLDDNGLDVSMISPYFNFTGDKSAMRRTLADAERYIGIASVLGAPLIRGFTGVVGSSEASKGQFDSCVTGLRDVCSLAKSNDISIALETHPKTLVDTLPATLRLIEAVDAPNLKINLDIYHLWEVHFDPLAILDTLYEHVAHVHAKNADIPPNSDYPLLHDQQGSQDIFGVTNLDSGNMFYDDFVRELRDRMFKGYISVEWFGPNISENAAGELRYLKRVESEKLTSSSPTSRKK